MSRAKILLGLAVVAAVLSLVFLPRGGEPEDDATTARSITLYGYDDQDPLWEIRAEDGRIEEDGQTLRGIAIDFHRADGKRLRIRGDQLDRSEGSARLSGAVRIERTDDLQLETDALTWIEADERLESGPIVLSTETLRVTAAQFGYDLSDDVASFGGGVDAHADLDATWTIRADRAEERDGIITFDGDVTADSAEGESFRCRQLEVDPEAESVRLVGDAEGEYASARLYAALIRIDSDGLWASGRVSAQMDLEEMGASDGP